MLKDRVRYLEGEIRDKYKFEGIVGNSNAILEVLKITSHVCRTESTVLVTGESGTGKELIARAVHYNSPRKDGPFVVINCGALPENLQESELFGHVKGAFTGAIRDKVGLFPAGTKWDNPIRRGRGDVAFYPSKTLEISSGWRNPPCWWK